MNAQPVLRPHEWTCLTPATEDGSCCEDPLVFYPLSRYSDFIMMNQKGRVKDGRQMRYRALPVIAFLVLTLLACGLSAGAEELTNDSRKTAVAVRITFRSRVRITGHGREFDTVEPSSGVGNVWFLSQFDVWFLSHPGDRSVR